MSDQNPGETLPSEDGRFRSLKPSFTEQYATFLGECVEKCFQLTDFHLSGLNQSGMYEMSNNIYICYFKMCNSLFFCKYFINQENEQDPEMHGFELHFDLILSIKSSKSSLIGTQILNIVPLFVYFFTQPPIFTFA